MMLELGSQTLTFDMLGAKVLDLGPIITLRQQVCVPFYKLKGLRGQKVFL